jgi:hypothetical protein
MHAYDPQQAPDPRGWLALDESERIALVEEFHWLANISLPNIRLHATIHAAVETQAALGEGTPVAAALDRLMAEGLDRHDAIHAIGSLLAELTYDVLDDAPAGGDPNAAFYERLPQLTARGWKESY